MLDAIEAMRSAFKYLSDKSTVAPVRTHIKTSSDDGSGLFMPVFLPQSRLFGVKVVSVYKRNRTKGLPAIHGLVTVFEADSGQPVAIMDGETLTAIRTGAASGLATELLARRDAKTLALFGTGPQARTQLQAVVAVRALEQVWILGRDFEKTRRFVESMAREFDCKIEASTETSVVREADIVCTATDTTVPLFEKDQLKQGVHINAIGSFTPEMCEISPDVLADAHIFVDQRAACRSEAGELIQAIKSGHLKPDTEFAELGEVVAGLAPSRLSESEVTLFKSVGNAVQDIAAAEVVLKNATKLGLGRPLNS